MTTDKTIPQKIGKYKVIKEIGRGGMGVVYLARDPFIKRPVAIKTAISDTAGDPKALARLQQQFFNEAQAAGKLDHPHIISVYDAAVENDQCYIVMEYVDGETLKKYCDKGSLLPVKRVVEIVFKCAKALDYAHRQGVIHRDIKHSNIMISKKGEVKITDFSIAMVEASDSTQPVGLVGSVRYMSPEQLREDTLTPQTDLFSLGVVMYELLAGAGPFPGESAHAVIYKIINEEPVPLSRQRSGIPKSLEAIVTRVLEKEPEKRYQTGIEFASKLSVAFSHLRLSDKEIGQQEKFNALKRIKFFKDFTAPELEEVIKASIWTKFSVDKHIITEGGIDDSFYIIVSGKVMAKKQGKPLAVLESGDCFGEMAYLGKTERTASIVALSDVMLMKINASLMDQASSNTQLRFYKVFVTTLIKRLTKTSELLCQTGKTG